MWAIRILTGPNAGQIHPLKAGRTIIGRAPHCQIQLAGSSGISKEHAHVIVTEDKIIISDAKSRNGTFVNGVRIQNQKLARGDKLSLHDMLFDIVILPDGAALRTSTPFFQGSAALQTQQWHPPANDAHLHLHAQTVQMQEPLQMHQVAIESVSETPSAPPLSVLIQSFKISAESYFDTVVMPGVFHFAEKFEFRFVLGVFVALYIIVVTSLTTVPMSSLIKSSIQDESGRRALTIARNLAAGNRQAILDNLEISVSTRQAELEEGVATAIIISSKDGHVIAPANQRGSFADKPFIHRARQSDKENVEQIDDSTVGASVPITYYNPELGTQSTAAHAVILYDMGSVALNKGQTLSLFIHSLAIASVLGALLFLFFIRLVEEPVRSLSSQLDQALRDGTDNISTRFRFPLAQTLAANINSALSRVGKDSSKEEVQPIGATQREPEAEGIVQMIGWPAMAISAVDQNIIAINPQLERLVRAVNGLKGRPLKELQDSALRQTIQDLLPTLRNTPSQIIMSELPFEGLPHEISAQAVMGPFEPAYYIVSVRKIELEGGYS